MGAHTVYQQHRSSNGCGFRRGVDRKEALAICLEPDRLADDELVGDLVGPALLLGGIGYAGCPGNRDQQQRQDHNDDKTG